MALRNLNILLIEKKVDFLNLPVRGEIASHVLTVLKVVVGDKIDIGAHNGPKGKATIIKVTSEELQISIQWQEPHMCDLYPVSLIAGLSRPQTCRKILEQASSLGVSKMNFFISEKSEPSYVESRLWKSDEWKKKIIKGIEQSFSTFIPECKIWSNLEECLFEQKKNSYRFAFDNYESLKTLEDSNAWKGRNHYTVAIGPERGWSSEERNLLRENNFLLVSMGPRVLRQETALVAGLGQIMGQFWKL